MKFTFNNQKDYETELHSNKILLNDVPHAFRHVSWQGNEFLVAFENGVRKVRIHPSGEDRLLVTVAGKVFEITEVDALENLIQQLAPDLAQASKEIQVTAPMPGTIVEYLVGEEKEVETGEGLFVLEAMKMENIVKAPQAGKIRIIGPAPGSTVQKGEPIIAFD